MLVLVTGGTGFLGRHIVQAVLAHGHRVRALVRKSSDISWLSGLPNTECRVADLHDHRSILPALQNVDAVIHAAGGGKIKRVKDFYYQNTHITEELVQSIRKSRQAHLRLILISSIAASGPSRKSGPKSEGDIARPVSHYGRSKLEAESVCQSIANTAHLTILRPPALYGPHDTKLLTVFKGVQKGLLLKPPGKKMSLLYGPDCADAVVASLEGNQPSGSIYFVDDGHEHTWRGFGQAIRDGLSQSGKRRRLLSVRVPSGLIFWGGAAGEIKARITGKPALLTRDKWRDGKQRYWLCSSERIHQELGFNAKTSLVDGIAQTLNWYRNEGWL
jgi:nucleoside-diphosphate-sugar epimerase